MPDQDTTEERAWTGETEKERLDRNLSELLGELRVALPGVQVLFAFLLIVPFSARYETVTPFQEKVYFTSLLLTAISSALLIAPTAHHRVQFRQRDKGHIVRTANRLTIAGLAVLALAMVGALLLITDFLFGTTTSIAVTGSATVIFAAVWFALPIYRRVTRQGVDDAIAPPLDREQSSETEAQQGR